MALWWCCILAAAIAGPCEPAVMPAQVMLRFYWQRLRQLPLLKDRDHGCPRETLAGTWFAWICQSSWGSKKTETRLDTIWHRAKTPKIGASSSTPQRNGGSTFNIPKKMESSIELLQPPAAVDWLWIGIPCRLSEGPWGWPVMSSHIIPEKCLSEKKDGKKKINLWSITVSPNKTILKQPFWGVPYKISPIATLMGCVNSPRHPRPGQAVRLPWDNTVVTRGHIEHPMFAKKPSGQGPKNLGSIGAADPKNPSQKWTRMTSTAENCLQKQLGSCFKMVDWSSLLRDLCGFKLRNQVCKRLSSTSHVASVKKWCHWVAFVGLGGSRFVTNPTL